VEQETQAALIKKIAGGDPSAMVGLYDGTSRLLFGLVLRVVGNSTLAEETLLDIYTHIWRQSASYDPSVLPLQWLTTIARARAIASLHWSKQDRRRRKLPAGNPNTETTVAPEQQKIARASFESLVPAQREILDWAYYSGLSSSEIAAQIGKPVGAIRTHARLGLGKLIDLFRPIFERATQAQSATGGHIEA